jgi:hypothetical protein
MAFLVASSGVFSVSMSLSTSIPKHIKIHTLVTIGMPSISEPIFQTVIIWKCQIHLTYRMFQAQRPREQKIRYIPPPLVALRIKILSYIFIGLSSRLYTRYFDKVCKSLTSFCLYSIILTLII